METQPDSVLDPIAEGLNPLATPLNAVAALGISQHSWVKEAPTIGEKATRTMLLYWAAYAVGIALVAIPFGILMILNLLGIIK